MTRLFDDEPYAIRVLQGVDVAADALYQAATTEFDRAQIEKLTSLFEGFAESAAGQWREIRHYIEAERKALDEVAEWKRVADVFGATTPDVLLRRMNELDAENARLRTVEQELESVAREAARS